MANETAKRDGNFVPVLMGVTNDTSLETRMLRVDPSTNRVLVSASAGSGFVTGSGASGQVSYWTGATSQSGDNNLFYDITNNFLGLKTAVPTHTFTLGSTATGIVSYNTVDQTTNYERILEGWGVATSNVYTIAAQAGGTGTVRNIQINANVSTNLFIGLDPNTAASVGISRNSTTSQLIFSVASTSLSGSSGLQSVVGILPTFAQTSTAGYRCLWISPFENTTGNGLKLLIDAGTNSGVSGGGTHTSKFAVDNTGKATKYSSVSTTGWGIPAIYGTGRATGQVAANASVAAYTVGAADGSFYISANTNVTTFSVGTFNVTCAYTDETNTSRTLTLNFSTITGTLGIAIAAAGAFEGIPVHIRCKASTAITIATTGTFTSLTYNVEGSITQIA